MAETKTAPMEYTKYEKARIVGSRALQISMGAPIMVEISKEDLEKVRFNPVEIAKLEYAAGKIPIDVVRSSPGRRRAIEAAEKEKKN